MIQEAVEGCNLDTNQFRSNSIKPSLFNTIRVDEYSIGYIFCYLKGNGLKKCEKKVEERRKREREESERD